ncbi:MAG: hypothetical protein DMF97_04025 [Acidobacteria bacterium]|nr:MAG: hypothetical protein DMF97_04025 [Acidobacteriota bacterium]PYR23612.1 MAG: hypothetical protein DMF98_18095 [Acidobacteriota bacterium]
MNQGNRGGSSRYRMAQDISAATTLDGWDAQATEQFAADTRVNRSPAHHSRRKDTFIATLAHELRQPLSAMLAAAEVVRMAPDAMVARRAAAVMRRQLGQMSRLVEDLVDATRWAQGKVTLQKCRLDLQRVMGDAVADVEGGQQIVVAGEREPIWVDGDQQRLLQVVSNLLRNAVKYTHLGGRITIVAERTASTIIVRVGDTGRGIEAEALPHLFDLYSQSRPQEGTGLGIGLSVVREIVLLHGGSVEAQSEGAGKGSEFIVRLPLAQNLELTPS